MFMKDNDLNVDDLIGELDNIASPTKERNEEAKQSSTKKVSYCADQDADKAGLSDEEEARSKTNAKPTQHHRKPNTS